MSLGHFRFHVKHLGVVCTDGRLRPFLAVQRPNRKPSLATLRHKEDAVPTRTHLSLAVVLLALGAWALSAQILPGPAVEPRMVFSGSDFGFRVERMDGNRPSGQLVVRIDGQWVPVRFENRVRPLR